MKHHPDRHVSAEPEEREKEEKIFKDVSEAYSVLSDPKKKNRYDSGHDLDDLEMPGEWCLLILRRFFLTRWLFCSLS